MPELPQIDFPTSHPKFRSLPLLPLPGRPRHRRRHARRHPGGEACRPARAQPSFRGRRHDAHRQRGEVRRSPIVTPGRTAIGFRHLFLRMRRATFADPTQFPPPSFRRKPESCFGPLRCSAAASWMPAFEVLKKFRADAMMRILQPSLRRKPQLAAKAGAELLSAAHSASGNRMHTPTVRRSARHFHNPGAVPFIVIRAQAGIQLWTSPLLSRCQLDAGFRRYRMHTSHRAYTTNRHGRA